MSGLKTCDQCRFFVSWTEYGNSFSDCSNKDIPIEIGDLIADALDEEQQLAVAEKCPNFEQRAPDWDQSYDSEFHKSELSEDIFGPVQESH